MIRQLKWLKQELCQMTIFDKIYLVPNKTDTHLENYIVQRRNKKTKRDSFEEEAAEAVQPERVLRRLR